MAEISYLTAPIHVWWDITSHCNFACRHCYSRSGQPSQQELTTQEVFDVIAEMKAMQVGFVYVLGGEPLIRPDFAEILTGFKEYGIPLMLNTNGWFIDHTWAKRLAASSVRQLRFSLDGATQEIHDKFRGMPGSFQRVIRGFQLCREAGIPHISCSFTMTKENIQDIAPTVALLVEHGVNAVQFGPIANTGRATDHSELVLDAVDTQGAASVLAQCITAYGDRINIYSVDGTYDKPCTQCVKKGLVKPSFMGCQAGRTCCCIDWDGNVIPCLLWREPIAGNVRQHSLREIWETSELFHNLRRHRGEDHVECRECFYSDVCARECPLSESQVEYGSERRTERVKMLTAKAKGNFAACVTLDGCHPQGL
jgi:radical SAM protein with 4Fe4S-binding SPASM domain